MCLPLFYPSSFLLFLPITVFPFYLSFLIFIFPILLILSTYLPFYLPIVYWMLRGVGGIQGKCTGMVDVYWGGVGVLWGCSGDAGCVKEMLIVYRKISKVLRMLFVKV